MTRPLTVVSVGYSLAPVSLDASGGAEVVLAGIDRALVARGDRSIVIAPPGSRVAGTLIETAAVPAEIDDAARDHAIDAVRAAIASVLDRYSVDVVHLHGLDFDRVIPSGVRTLVTLHLPIDWYPPGAIARAAEAGAIACVSETQRADLPPALRARAHVIENGVDLARHRLRVRKSGYALALGRICPEKGFALALDAAREAATPIVLAGTVHPYPSHREHFQRELVPRLGPGATWIGAIEGALKLQWLAGARCVVVPSLVRETSSLVAMEALASGAPVVALRSGALASIVEHGRTGWLADDVAGLAAGIRDAHRIDPRACRASAEARFDRARSTARWAELLRALAPPRADRSQGVEVDRAVL